MEELLAIVLACACAVAALLLIGVAENWNWAAGETISAKLKFFYGADKPEIATFTISRKE